MKNFLVLFLILLSQAASAQLTKEEKKIIENVKKQMPQTLRMLEQLVNVNSGTLNVEGVRKTGDLLRREFDKIGFTTEWISLPDSLKRAGHLVAYRKGNVGKKIFLIGHLDTVFEPDMPANPYRVLNDSTATGQGVNDMKGGDMVILAALKALNTSKLLKNTTITAYFTGDEEKSGSPISVSRGDFIERARQSEIALAFEGAGGLTSVADARRGSSGWQLNVYGKQAHSSGVFKVGYGAIYEASRIVNEFREQLSSEKYLTFNPGIFVGGSELAYDSAAIKAQVAGKTNIISPSAFVQGDLRFLTEVQKKEAREKMKLIAASNNLAGTRAEISFEDGIPSMEPTTGNRNLVQILDKVSRDMRVGRVRAGDPGGRGAGDISYVAQFVDALDGLGASGIGSHAPGETINLKEFPVLIQRAALFIYRLTRQ
ncbi:M20/M25/M40 family metallo-hydrolase [Segetibacter sp.]|uniref:M20/M25/M40 family metallo-hydrolase n=1 Tax=Segetibacter sp. TaxID=2231182 RepID=UPI002602533B|nr:M20/M25/M40 family metallo-hydrolase [Segetibacter sp.]MCW3080194.1 peptidase [Segetibacter sp.]